MSIQGVTLSIFWGSLFAKYLWVRREEICEQVASTVKKTSSSIWNAARQKLANVNKLKQKQNQEDKDRSEKVELEQSNENQEKQQKSKIAKQKRISKEKSKVNNLRRRSKKLQIWLIQKQRTETTSEQEIPVIIFDRQGNELAQNGSNEALRHYQQYENGEQAEIMNVLGYDPFEPQNEQQQKPFECIIATND